MLSNDQIQTKLNQLQSQHHNDITSCVISEALEYHDPSSFFSDLMEYGCSSGIVSSLIYYTDTHKFYDTHYDEIEELRTDFDITIDPDQDLKNQLAWMAFEYNAHYLGNILELL